MSVRLRLATGHDGVEERHVLNRFTSRSPVYVSGRGSRNRRVGRVGPSDEADMADQGQGGRGDRPEAD